MLIEEYLRMRIQSAEELLAGEVLGGNVPKAMAEKAVIAELRGVEAFLNNSSESDVVDNLVSHNKRYECNDCEIGIPEPCASPYWEDEPKPDSCVFEANGRDCEWVLVKRNSQKVNHYKVQKGG